MKDARMQGTLGVFVKDSRHSWSLSEGFKALLES